MPVPKPEPLPRAYVEEYYANWWRRLTHRRPDSTLVGRCSNRECRKRGILGFDLVHRGTPRHTNLLCDNCAKESDHGESKEAPPGRTRLGKRRLV